jgi:single-strand DNA-binding protein
MPATQITIIGNLTDDPELKFTPSGQPVGSFTVASNERYRDNSGQWQDGATSFYRVNAWDKLAEHAAESLRRGHRVIVAGTLRQRTYEVQPSHPGDSGKRTVWEVRASDVGAALSGATVKVTKVRRDTAPLPEDPYATTAAAAVPSQASPADRANESRGYSDEPPF